MRFKEADVTEPLTPPSTKRKGLTAATYWTPLQSPFNGGITRGTEKVIKTSFPHLVGVLDSEATSSRLRLYCILHPILTNLKQ